MFVLWQGKHNLNHEFDPKQPGKERKGHAKQVKQTKKDQKALRICH
jgi:hypothetical protein